MNNVLLSNGVEMPHMGLGTYPMKGQKLADTVIKAYKVGYRMFDTADNYYNEEDLGESLKKLYKSYGSIRNELFLVSKVSDELYGVDSPGGSLNRGIYFWKTSPFMQRLNSVHDVVRDKITSSLKKLHTDYLDLYLMHWPYPDYFQEIWYEMEQLYKEGFVRAIGVCNCRERHLESLKTNCMIRPMVNQFESSPINTKKKLIDYCNANDIRVMIYSPLMSLRSKESSYLKYIQELSKKYKRSDAQINLRFDIQRGLIPIPKSSNEKRLKENISIFDFSLTPNEMENLYSFNVDYQTLPESKSCPGL